MVPLQRLQGPVEELPVQQLQVKRAGHQSGVAIASPYSSTEQWAGKHLQLAHGAQSCRHRLIPVYLCYGWLLNGWHLTAANVLCRRYLYSQMSKWLKSGAGEYKLDGVYVWNAGQLARPLAIASDSVCVRSRAAAYSYE